MKLPSILSAILLTAAVAFAAPEIGKPAPDFSLTDSKGAKHSLADYKGKYVVLEWVNYGCPFVKKHYDSTNMQALQKDATANDVVWLTICSSAPGKQGHMAAADVNKELAAKGSAPKAYLIDEAGTVGKAYDAKTTPEMFVINPEGVLIYMGAIDDKPTVDIADVAGAKNYVKAALASAKAGQPVAEAKTKSYGCSVKYP
jgi:peroxiredoxin